MGRELKRVAINFDWPLGKPWKGFLNPHYTATQCAACGGNGYSAEGNRLKDLWYGKLPFRPEDRGSTPFQPTDTCARIFAERKVSRSTKYYGRGEMAVQLEARRICGLWNRSWSHHLNVNDVAALITADRLHDFTHVPTPREVNVWSTSGMGHDSINEWVCVRAECERLGVAHTCATCGGDGEIWPSPETKKVHEDWESYEPPVGEGFQIWETVSEGSPISPVFSTAQDLARYMATTKWGADTGTSFETWMKFIEGPGWAPSGIYTPETGFVNGVTGVVSVADKDEEETS